MPPEVKTTDLLTQLHEKRQKLVDAWSESITARETVRGEFEARAAESDEAKRPSADELKAHKDAEVAFRADCDQREAEIREFDKRIEDQSEIVRRRIEAAAGHKGTDTRVTHEPMTYRRDNAHQISYYADLALKMVPEITLQTRNRSEAEQRLERHAREMDVEMPKRIEAAEKRARERYAEAETRSVNRRTRRQLRDMDEVRPLAYDPFQRGARWNPIEKRVEPNRQDGYGGYFSPPLWLPEEYIKGLRAQGVARDLCRQLDLPPGTDSINIPKLANLTAVGYQTADGAGVLTKDWSDTFVQANIKTAAGDSDVALQLLEQSPNGITDEVITTDLMAAYDQFVDLQVIAGDGLNTGTLSGGHIAGIYPSTNWAGTNSVTYTDGSPSGQHFIPGVLGPMASKISHTRFDAEDFKIVMHGRRWFWFSTSLDTNGRPLGETMSGGRYNTASNEDAPLAAYGLVGSLPFLADAPVYIDNNIPTNDTTGGGSNQDIAIGALWNDLWLFMGDLRTNVYREVLSGSLGVRFQVYNYFAYLERYGQSVAVATGSGFAAPSTGYGDTF